MQVLLNFGLGLHLCVRLHLDTSHGPHSFPQWLRAAFSEVILPHPFNSQFKMAQISSEYRNISSSYQGYYVL